MTKKKRGHPTAEEVLARPWCYYCERDFDDLKILISHQKAKHFKCEKCGRRLNTAGGLSVHMTQVHKESLEAVENALPNRSGLNVEIFGMEGIPEDVVQQHNQRVLTQFHEAEAERRAVTGNPAPGGSEGGVSKKPKVEDSGDLKARLAAFKAKKASGVSGTSSGDATPTGAHAGQSNEASQSPNSYPPHQYPAQANPAAQSPFQPQAFGSPGYGQHSPFPQSLSPFNQGPTGFTPPSQHGPPGMQAYQSFPQSQQYGPLSPPPPSTYQQGFAQTGSPVQNGSLARPPSGLPAASGLPQRPAFGAPQATPSQLQQMHQGQYPMHTSEQPPAQDSQVRPPSASAQNRAQADSHPVVTEADVDNLIANAAKQSTATSGQPQETTQADASVEKKSKKDKDRATRLFYENNEISPEEKMAKMSRYAFDPSDPKPNTVFGDAVEATVTGAVDDGAQEE